MLAVRNESGEGNVVGILDSITIPCSKVSRIEHQKQQQR